MVHKVHYKMDQGVSGESCQNSALKISSLTDSSQEGNKGHQTSMQPSKSSSLSRKYKSPVTSYKIPHESGVLGA